MAAGKKSIPDSFAGQAAGQKGMQARQLGRRACHAALQGRKACQAAEQARQLGRWAAKRQRCRCAGYAQVALDSLDSLVTSAKRSMEAQLLETVEK